MPFNNRRNIIYDSQVYNYWSTTQTGPIALAPQIQHSIALSGAADLSHFVVQVAIANQQTHPPYPWLCQFDSFCCLAFLIEQCKLELLGQTYSRVSPESISESTAPCIISVIATRSYSNLPLLSNRLQRQGNLPESFNFSRSRLRLSYVH